MLSHEAAELLRQLLDLDRGQGVVVQHSADIDAALVDELEAAYCLERHRLTGGRDGMHLLLLPAAARVLHAHDTTARRE